MSSSISDDLLLVLDSEDAVVLPFDEQIAALPGLFAYYPLTDTSGTTADNAEGTASYDGTYAGTRTLANSVFPAADSDNVVTLNAGYVDLPETTLRTVIDWSKGWWLGWFKPTTASLTDGAQHQIFSFRRNSAEFITVYKNTDYTINSQIRMGAVGALIDWGIARDEWCLHGFTWDSANSVAKMFVDGVFMESRTIATPILGAVSAASATIGFANGSWKGGMAHHALGAGDVYTEAQINSIYEAVMGTTREITFAGDSKTNYNDPWPTRLMSALKTETSTVWRERPRRFAVAGDKVANLQADLESDLSSTLGNPEIVLITVGANDQSQGTGESAFKTALTACIDAYRSKFSNADIYIAFPYREDVATPTSPATMKTWIQDVIATYGSNVFAGHDETVWFANNIATYSDDGAHYNAAGQTEVINQWLTVLGY